MGNVAAKVLQLSSIGISACVSFGSDVVGELLEYMQLFTEML